MFINGLQEEVYMVQHRTIKGENVIKLQCESGTVVTLVRSELEAMINQLKMEPLATKSTT